MKLRTECFREWFFQQFLQTDKKRSKALLSKNIDKRSFSISLMNNLKLIKIQKQQKFKTYGSNKRRCSKCGRISSRKILLKDYCISCYDNVMFKLKTLDIL